MKTNFQLPTTSISIVVYKDNKGKLQETLIPTPANNDMLVWIMLKDFKVGYSQIRAVKAVNPHEMLRNDV